jgi:dipeptidyl aminopeptidase/acylaminoacyl peptidase
MLDLAAYAAWETHPARRWVIARSVRAFAGDSEGSRPDLLRYASPVAYVRPETPPVMLVHGAGDWLVPHQASRSFKAAMDAAGAHCEYIEKDRRNHGFDYVRVGERRRLFKRMLAFYREHLLLKEAV